MRAQFGHQHSGCTSVFRHSQEPPRGFCFLFPHFEVVKTQPSVYMQHSLPARGLCWLPKAPQRRLGRCQHRQTVSQLQSVLHFQWLKAAQNQWKWLPSPCAARPDTVFCLLNNHQQTEIYKYMYRGDMIIHDSSSHRQELSKAPSYSDPPVTTSHSRGPYTSADVRVWRDWFLSPLGHLWSQSHPTGWNESIQNPLPYSPSGLTFFPWGTSFE